MARKPHSTSLVLLLVCIFAFWWGIAVLAGQTSPAQSLYQPTGASASANATDNTLVVNESHSGNTFTYSGTYKPANSCDALGSGIRYSQGDQVTVILTTVATTDCTQTAAQPFTVSIKNTNGIPTFGGVQLNGQPIAATLKS